MTYPAGALVLVRVPFDEARRRIRLGNCPAGLRTGAPPSAAAFGKKRSASCGLLSGGGMTPELWTRCRESEAEGGLDIWMGPTTVALIPMRQVAVC